MRFVVSNLSPEELLALKNGKAIVSKLLLVPDDYRVFHYKEGDEIEVETQEGDRLRTTIQHLEVVEEGESVIVILTLSPNSKERTADL